MEIKLENESLELTINSFGASKQVHSICGMPMRNTGREAHRCFSRLSAA